MSYTKNLGRVKGKKGNYFTPQIFIEEGQLHFKWIETETANEESQGNAFDIPIDVPIFIPEYNSSTGNLSFKPTVPIKDRNTLITPDNASSMYSFHIKGEKGDPGVVKLNMVHTNKTIAQLRTQLEEETLNDNISFSSDTIYFTTTEDINIEDAYIYDDTKNDFFMMEGIKLSEYYKKNETYSKEEVDDFIDTQNEYLERIYALLDEPNDVYSINGQEINSDMLDAILDANYVKLENTSYEEHNGIIYFIPYSGD